MLGEDELLISWLKNEREDLVKTAEAKYQSKIAKVIDQLVVPETKRLFFRMLFIVFADPNVFDGRSILSGDSKQHAQLTSGVVSGATLINAMTNAPILLYAFAYAGIAALPLSTSLNFVILWWTNQTGTTAASRKRGNRLWSITGAVAFLAMSTVQSLASGIGAELINNQEGISTRKAELVAQEYIDKLDRSYENWRTKAQNECDEAIATLDTRNTNYVDVYGGTWGQRESGQLQNEDAPCTPKSLTQYEGEALTAFESLEAADRLRASLKNEIEFLRAVNIYDQHFHPETLNEGTKDERTVNALNSGSEAITLASESFFDSLGAASERFQEAIGQRQSGVDEDVEQSRPGINMSIFFFALSVITSLSATVLIITHSFKQETQMSHSKKVEESVSYWLESVRRQYAQRIEDDTEDDTRKDSRVNQKLLSLYIDEYRDTGKCEYPKVQAIAKLSQEGMDLRLIQDGQALITDIDAAYISIDAASTVLIKHFVKIQNQSANNKGLLGAVKGFFVGDDSPGNTTTDSDQDGQKNDLVKNNLSKLRQGVTRLILLSNRYAAVISLSGDKEYYTAIKTLEKQLKESMQMIQTMPFEGFSHDHIQVASMTPSVKALPAQLVQLQVDCVELKEITKEEIRNKLITIFQTEATD